MKDFADRLCDHLLKTYGDMMFVSPPVLANAIRVVAELPEDASPLHFEQWVSKFADVRVNVASSELPGWHHSLDGRPVIETGRGRSVEERNLTIPHEFGEILRDALNEELGRRDLLGIHWEDRAWDQLAAELMFPITAFRSAARKNGCDILDLRGNLSFEAVVMRLKEAFDDEIPLFAVYAKNATEYNRGVGHAGDEWRVARSAWTKHWMRHSFSGRQEILRVPRAHDHVPEGCLVDEVRRKGRALLVHTTDRAGNSLVETSILLRPREYRQGVAQVFVVGVEKRYGSALAPQVQLVGPAERTATFAQVFGG